MRQAPHAGGEGPQLLRGRAADDGAAVEVAVADHLLERRKADTGRAGGGGVLDEPRSDLAGGGAAGLVVVDPAALGAGRAGALVAVAAEGADVPRQVPGELAAAGDVLAVGRAGLGPVGGLVGGRRHLRDVRDRRRLVLGLRLGLWFGLWFGLGLLLLGDGLFNRLRRFDFRLGLDGRRLGDGLGLLVGFGFGLDLGLDLRRLGGAVVLLGDERQLGIVVVVGHVLENVGVGPAGGVEVERRGRGLALVLPIGQRQLVGRPLGRLGRGRGRLVDAVVDAIIDVGRLASLGLGGLNRLALAASGGALAGLGEVQAIGGVGGVVAVPAVARGAAVAPTNGGGRVGLVGVGREVVGIQNAHLNVVGLVEGKSARLIRAAEILGEVDGRVAVEVGVGHAMGRTGVAGIAGACHGGAARRWGLPRGGGGRGGRG